MLADLLEGMGSILKAPDPDEDLVEWASTSLRTVVEKPPMKPGDWLRASKVGYLCPREEVLCFKYDITRTEVITADNRWTFDIGTSMHWGMQNLVLGPQKKIVGVWRCRQCGKLHGSYEENDIRFFPEGCEQDGTHDAGFDYVEATILHHDLLLSGHLDGLHPNPDDIWEFKTANPFAVLRMMKDGLPSHYRIQIHPYLRGVGRKRARFVFLNKGENSIKKGWKTLNVEFDPEIWDGVRRDILDLREGLDGGPVPDRICATADCPRAKSCPVRAQCFGSAMVGE